MATGFDTTTKRRRRVADVAYPGCPRLGQLRPEGITDRNPADPSAST
jgi:hypothetical protein